MSVEFVNQFDPTAIEAKIQRAQRSATQTTTTWADKLIKEKLIRLNPDIPQSVIKKYRVFKKMRGGRGGEYGDILTGFNPVKAKFAGKIEVAEDGVFAGRFFFQKAFYAAIAHNTNREPSIYKRKGRSRFPVVEQKVEVLHVPELIESLLPVIAAEMKLRFETKMGES